MRAGPGPGSSRQPPTHPRRPRLALEPKPGRQGQMLLCMVCTRIRTLRTSRAAKAGSQSRYPVGQVQCAIEEVPEQAKDPLRQTETRPLPTKGKSMALRPAKANDHRTSDGCQAHDDKTHQRSEEEPFSRRWSPPHRICDPGGASRLLLSLRRTGPALCF